MRSVRKGIFFLGLLLLLSSAGLLTFTQVQAHQAEKKAAERAALLESLLPAKTIGAMEDYTSMEMPALAIGEDDFIGLIDIPALGMTLPIGSSWDTDKVREYPCRFYGTVYDGSLIIGGADQKGQFANFDRLDTGAAVTVTDMTGAAFSYTITRIDRAKRADADRLMDGEYDLTLFVRDAFGLEYILVRCAMGFGN